MTSNRLPVAPPRLVTWLVQLFASPQEVEGVLGDLTEEFSSSLLVYGYTEACRRYRRQAWRTIRDLALSPLQDRPSSSTAITMSGVALTAGIGLAGLIMDWPISWSLNEISRVIMTRDPVTFFIPAPAVRSGIDLLGLLLTGALVTTVGRVFRVRAMSAALATVAVMAIEIAIDRPVTMWLYAPPFAAPFAFGSWFVRWARGVLIFGSAVMIGAAIVRILIRRDDALQSHTSG